MEPRRNSLIYVKAAWTVISGTHLRATSEVVEHELDRMKDMCLNGLTSFRAPSTKSDHELESHVAPAMYKFVLALRKFLGLDAMQTWDLLSSYLMYEFQGPETGLQVFIESEEKKTMLMTDIWMFYHSERLFLLKCINLVVTHYTNIEHPYRESLSNFMCKFDEDKFLYSLITQLEIVTSEPYPHKDIHGPLMTDHFQIRWENYNLREQIEVIHNMIIYTQMKGVNLGILPKILQICVDSHFGKQEEYKLHDTSLSKQYVQIIGFLQNILLLQHTNYLIQHVIDTGELPVNLEDVISNLGDEEEQALTILSWTLAKTFDSKSNGSTDILEKLGCIAADSGAFEYLQKLVKSEMLCDDTQLSTVVYKTVFDFVSFFINHFEEEALHTIKGLVRLSAPLLKNTYIVEKFWSYDEGLKLLFKAITERFPAEFTPFIEALDSLALYGPSHIHKLIHIMIDTKSYSEYIDVSTLQDFVSPISTSPDHVEWKLTTARKPMEYSSFILPNGTAGHYIDEDAKLFIWTCEFNVFEALYNTQREVIFQITNFDQVVQPETLQNAISSLRFLKNFLATGVELTREMILVINYVFTMISKLKEMSSPFTLLFALCLDISIVLIYKYPTEVLGRLKHSDVLPILHSLPENIVNIFDSEYFSPKTIGNLIASEECVNGEYPLLTTYLTLIYVLLQGGSRDMDLEEAVELYLPIILPGVVFILGDIYPNYQDWHFINEREHDRVAVTCAKIFHVILSVDSACSTQKCIVTPVQLVRHLVLFSFLNMSSGKVLLKIVASGESFMQTRMERQLNWVSGQGTRAIHLLQLCLSLLNRVLLMKQCVQDEFSSLESDIYCSPTGSLHVIPVVASYLNNSFSRLLPVLAVKVLRRFALVYPKTLLPCLRMESDVLRELIFRRLNSRMDSDRLKVALLELVSACIDTQPGMCDAFFNLPTERAIEENECTDQLYAHAPKPDFLRKRQVKDHTQGGCLMFVLAVLENVSGDPAMAKLSLYGAAVDLICSLWAGEHTAAVEYLRHKEHFWTLFCAPLFVKPDLYVYAFTQVFSIITLEIFNFGKGVHPDLLKCMETFFKFQDSHFNNWSEFVSNIFTSPKYQTDVPVLSSKNPKPRKLEPVWAQGIVVEDEDKEEEEPKIFPAQKMERQPPSIQMLIAWKRFVIISMKLLPYKINAEQKIILTRNIMKALQHEIETMSLKPILILVEFYLVLIADWHSQFFDDREIAKNQLYNLTKTFSASYPLLPSRVREALLALTLRVMGCLKEELQKDEVVAESILTSVRTMVLLELDDSAVPQHLVKLRTRSYDVMHTEVIELLHASIPGANLNGLALNYSLSGQLSVALLRTVFNILKGNNLWLRPEKTVPLRSALLNGLGKTLHQLHVVTNTHNLYMSINVTNLVFLMMENSPLDYILEQELPQSLWMELIPPRSKERKHWMLTTWPLIYKAGLQIITYYFNFRQFMFLEKVISFTAIHHEYIVDAILAFRFHLESKMLDFSLTALNFVLSLSMYPSHWRLYDEMSLVNITQGVATCLNMSVALLINPVMLNQLSERPEKKIEKKTNLGVTDTPPSTQIIAAHNQLLKITFLCLSILQQHSPRLLYLLTECVKTPVCAEPLVGPALDSPLFDRHAMVPVTFGTLITLANICTLALSKGVRVPSPRHVGSFRAGTSLLLSMDKNITSSVFEMTVEMITAQGLVYLLNEKFSPADKELFRRNLNTEMTFFIEFSKRSVRELLPGRSLESILHGIKLYLAYEVKLPLFQSAPVEKTQVKVRRLLLRDSETRSTGSRSASSSPLKGSVLSSKASSQTQLDSIKDLLQSDCVSPFNEEFIRLIAIVFNSLFDLFNTGMDIT